MTNDFENEVPVLIAGAGPAGLATATELARHGIRSLLVERRAETSQLPRATAVSIRSMELMRAWGLEDEVRAGAIDAEWLMLRCDTLAQAASGMAAADRHAHEAAERPPQPGRAGVRAAGSPGGRAAAASPLPGGRTRRVRHRGRVGRQRAGRRPRRAARRGQRGLAGRPCPLPRRGRRCAQQRPACARHSHARPRSPGGGRHGAVPRAPVGRARRLPARHLQRHAPRRPRALPARRPGRPLALRGVLGPRGRAGGGLRRGPDDGTDPPRSGSARPRAADRAHRGLLVRREDRRRVPAAAARS